MAGSRRPRGKEVGIGSSSDFTLKFASRHPGVGAGGRNGGLDRCRIRQSPFRVETADAYSGSDSDHRRVQNMVI